jgi:hypothetical protein
MSTVFEIEQAIASLSEEERIALENRLIVKRFGIDALPAEEHAELMESLDEAERDFEEGRVYTLDEVRKSIRQWTGR